MAPLVPLAAGAVASWAGGEIGKGATATPGAPNLTSAAQQQANEAKANVNQQTQANRANQSTPFGFNNWTQDANGNWSQSTGFAPGMQGTFDSLSQQARDANSKPMDDGSAAREQAINAAWGQSTARLDPMWAQREQAQNTQLANQGLDASSEAARNAGTSFGNARNDAYQSALRDAIGQGTAAQQATFSQNMAARNNPMQQLLAMYGGLNNMPGYNAAGVAGPANYLGAAAQEGDWYQQGQKRAADERNALYGAGAQLVGSVAGMAGAKSDERVKTNIHRLDEEAIPGVPMATFEYKAHPGKKYKGVIAQDLEKVAPDQVREDPDGIKRVSAHFAPFSFKKR